MNINTRLANIEKAVGGGACPACAERGHEILTVADQAEARAIDRRCPVCARLIVVQILIGVSLEDI